MNGVKHTSEVESADASSLQTAILQLKARLRTEPAAVYQQVGVLLSEGAESGKSDVSIELHLIAARACINMGMPEDGIVHAREARAIAEFLHDQRKLCLADLELGVCLFILLRYQEAEDVYKRGLLIAQSFGTLEDLSRFCVNLANLYSRSDRHVESIVEYEKALDIAQSIGDVLLQAKVLTNISSFFGVILNDYDRAVEYCRDAKAKYDALNDFMGSGKASANMGLYLSRLEKHHEALQCHKDALACKLRGSDRFETILSYYHVATTHAFILQMDEARAWYSEMEAYLNSLPRSSVEWRYADLALGTIRYQEGRIEDAIDLWHRVREWMCTMPMSEDLRLVNSFLAEAYEKLGRYELAAEYLKFVYEYEDAESHRRAAMRLSYIAAKYKLEQERGKAEIERLRNVELVSAIKRREELNRDKERYLAFIAHELKEPLATASTIAAVLLHDDALEQSERSEFSNELSTVVRKMVGLVSSLISRRTDVDARSLFDVSKVWSQSVRTWSSRAAHKRIQLDVQTGDEELLVEATEQQLLTIIDNIVSNSIKYTPVFGNVSVRIEGLVDNNRKYARLVVSDTGPGIQSQDLEKLFQPWQTLSAVPTGNEISTGLGLYFVKCEVESLGGDIAYDGSTNKGATFILRLPIADSAQSSAIKGQL
jgi:signal transduction histidine kinase